MKSKLYVVDDCLNLDEVHEVLHSVVRAQVSHRAYCSECSERVDVEVRTTDVYDKAERLLRAFSYRASPAGEPVGIDSFTKDDPKRREPLVVHGDS